MDEYKCCNCGAKLEPSDDSDTIVCPYCKSVFKIPQVNSQEVKQLLDRAFFVLEDGEFERADKYLEKALDLQPRNSMAYIGKLMVDYGVQKEKHLGGLTKRLNQSPYFEKAIRFGDEKCKQKLIAYDQANEERINLLTYQAAKELMNEKDYLSAMDLFTQIENYKDSAKLSKFCKNKFNNNFRMHSIKMIIIMVIVILISSVVIFIIFERYVAQYWYFLLILDVALISVIMCFLKRKL